MNIDEEASADLAKDDQSERRMMVGTSALVECERIVGYVCDVPVARILATDLWVTGAGVGAVAILLRPRLEAISAVMAGSSSA